MREDTTFGLTPERLSRILAMGLKNGDGQDDAEVNRAPVQALQGMLSRKVTLDAAEPESLPAILNRPCDELSAITGRTISELLLDSETDLAVIKTLKDYGKELVRRGAPEARVSAATAIYYAAIASALVFHGHKITRHSYPRLREAYVKLEQEPWMSHELKDLFRRARAVCQQTK